MRMKLIGSLLAAGVLGTASIAVAQQATSQDAPSTSAGASATTGTTGSANTSGAAGTSGSASTSGSATMSLNELCMHTRLSAADQADCKQRVSAATTETQRMEVRRMFEAKAGISAGVSGTSGTSGTTPRTNPNVGNDSSVLDQGRAGRPGGTSVGDPIGSGAARDAGTAGTTSKPLGPN